MHALATRLRLFRIWQKTGEIPFHKSKGSGNKNDFFRGSFDSIPFMNDDAKRTFSHLLLRPGYMIRDYLNGKHDIYLAPLTSLLIFYAFFSLVSSVVNPTVEERPLPDKSKIIVETTSDPVATSLKNAMDFVVDCYVWAHLDLYPKAVDTPAKASLAAFESNLRSQGIPEFLSEFILLWFALWLLLRRRYGMGLSACATISAYVLCQVSFLMLFALLFKGDKTEISVILLCLFAMLDFRQLFGFKWGKCFRMTVCTAFFMVLGIILLFALAGLALAGYVMIVKA